MNSLIQNHIFSTRAIRNKNHLGPQVFVIIKRRDYKYYVGVTDKSYNTRDMNITNEHFITQELTKLGDDAFNVYIIPCDSLDQANKLESFMIKQPELECSKCYNIINATDDGTSFLKAMWDKETKDTVSTKETNNETTKGVLV